MTNMPKVPRLRKPLLLVALTFIGLVVFPTLLFMTSRDIPSSRPIRTNEQSAAQKDPAKSGSPEPIFIDPALSLGGAIMPHLGNATAKAELGRATWKLIHTMAARYPVKPTPDERAAVKQWIHLLSRLYPCGECAEHFQKLLKEHPPQTSSRIALSNWTCSVHNLVNKRLGKEEFDCSTLADVYQCGCADADENSSKEKEKLASDPGAGSASTSASAKVTATH